MRTRTRGSAVLYRSSRNPRRQEQTVYATSCIARLPTSDGPKSPRSGLLAGRRHRRAGHRRRPRLAGMLSVRAGGTPASILDAICGDPRRPTARDARHRRRRGRAGATAPTATAIAGGDPQQPGVRRSRSARDMLRRRTPAPPAGRDGLGGGHRRPHGTAAATRPSRRASSAPTPVLRRGSIRPAARPAADRGRGQHPAARAAAATASNDAIIAVVDRNGHILGVRVEGDVSPAITGNTGRSSSSPSTAPCRRGPHRGVLRQQPGPATSRHHPVSSANRRSPSARSSPTRTSPTRTRPSAAPASSPRSASAATSRRASRSRRRSTCSRSSTPTATASSARPRPHPRDGRRHPAAERFNIDPAFVPPGQELIRRRTPTASSPACSRRPSRAASPRCRAASRSSRTAPLVGGIGVFFPGTDRLRDRGELGLSTTSTTRPSPTGRWRPSTIAFAAAGGRLAGRRLRPPATDRRRPRCRPGSTCRSAASTWSASRWTSSARAASRGRRTCVDVRH